MVGTKTVQRFLRVGLISVCPTAVCGVGSGERGGLWWRPRLGGRSHSSVCWSGIVLFQNISPTAVDQTAGGRGEWIRRVGLQHRRGDVMSWLFKFINTSLIFFQPFPNRKIGNRKSKILRFSDIFCMTNLSSGPSDTFSKAWKLGNNCCVGQRSAFLFN